MIEEVVKNKVIVFNGLSSDIGESIAKVLSGAKIYGTYNKNKPKYGQSTKINYLSEDFEARINSFVDKVFKAEGKIDVLLNIAGIWLIKPFLYEETEDMGTVFRINYEVPVVFSRAVIRKMLANGSGDIINISSTAGVTGSGQMISYGASKAALINLTKSLAEEFGPRNIKVNCISPGPTKTKAWHEKIDTVATELMIKSIPKSRLCEPDDVAMAVLGILMNDYQTGSNLVLNGGKL